MSETYELSVTKVIRAPRATVFEAWTTPSWLERWYGLADDWRTPVAEVDLRVGGRYRLGLQPPGSSVFHEAGEYLEVVADERLVYTVESTAWEGTQTVTVEFRDHADGTEVVLVESGFPTAALRDEHAGGWPRFVDRLARAVEVPVSPVTG
jgi:uncharacterized protein YndB with AHSA1/START domain